MKHIKVLLNQLTRKLERQQAAADATRAQIETLEPMLQDPSQLTAFEESKTDTKKK